MSTDNNDTNRKAASASKAPGPNNILLESAEWADHNGERVIGEYHMKGHPVTHIEYDMENRPDHKGPPAKKRSAKKRPGSRITNKKSPAKGSASKPSKHRSLASRAIDISTLEVISYAIFRAMFGKSIMVPLKVEGVIDMDFAVKNNDVTLNTDVIALTPPQLQIWRFIFSYKHKPVLEYGRGIESGVKIHYWRAFLLLLAMWWGSNKPVKNKKIPARTRVTN